MSTMISVIGNSHTGKTSLSIMLAHALTNNKNKTAIVFSLDNYNSEYPVLFPKNEEECSLSLLSLIYSPTYTKTDLVKYIISKKIYPNIGYLSFSISDHIFSYPNYDNKTVDRFIDSLNNIADYIIFDFPHDLSSSSLLLKCLSSSSFLFTLFTPNIKSEIYEYMHYEYINKVFKGEHKYKVLNNIEKKIYYPVNEYDYNIVIPYSQNIKSNYYNGKTSTYSFSKEILSLSKTIQEMENYINAKQTNI